MASSAHLEAGKYASSVAPVVSDAGHHDKGSQGTLNMSPETVAQLLENVPDALVVVDAHGQIQFVNAQAEIMFGYPRQKMLGNPVELLVPPEVAKTHVKHRTRFVEEPSVRPMGKGLDLRGVRQDGTSFPVEISLAPLVTEEGIMVVAAVRNVTDQRRQRERFKALLDAAPDAMVIVDRHGHILLVNAQAERLFGYDRVDLVGSEVERLIPARFREAHPDHRDRYFEEPNYRPMGAGLELFGLHKDGHEFPVEISLAPLTTDEGDVALAAIRDVSDRRVQEAQLAKYTEELRRSNEELENFAYIASHDLQEPLRMITGFLSVIEKRYAEELGEEGQEYITFAVDGAERMRALILGLLDFSRVNTQEAQLVDVDMRQVVDATLADLDGLIKDNRARIEINGDLPRSVADATQIGRVWQNLISNAMKFVAPGEDPHIVLRGRVDERRGCARYEVQDNGIGIDEHNRDRVFQIFQRLHDRDKYPGTGIGLAICRKIVERCGGSMGIEPAPTGGSTFWFELPIATS